MLTHASVMHLAPSLLRGRRRMQMQRNRWLKGASRGKRRGRLRNACLVWTFRFRAQQRAAMRKPRHPARPQPMPVLLLRSSSLPRYAAVGGMSESLPV